MKEGTSKYFFFFVFENVKCSLNFMNFFYYSRGYILNKFIEFCEFIGNYLNLFGRKILV